MLVCSKLSEEKGAKQTSLGGSRVHHGGDVGAVVDPECLWSPRAPAGPVCG